MLETIPVSTVIRDYNKLDYKNWSAGVPHPFPFSVSPNGFGYAQVNASDTTMVNVLGPLGKQTPVRRGAVSAQSVVVAGGLYHEAIPIDNTKNYRLSFWLNIRSLALNSYDNSCINFGVDTFDGAPNTQEVTRLVCTKLSIGGSGPTDNNPYFHVVLYDQLPQNEWLLLVGYILNKDEEVNGPLTQQVLQTFGIYRENGQHITHADLANYNFTPTAEAYRNVYKFHPNATHMYLRAFTNPVRTVGDTMDFAYPRIDLMDGREPSIARLLRDWDIRLGADV